MQGVALKEGHLPVATLDLEQPTELFIKIFGHLTEQQLLKVGRVNSLFRVAAAQAYYLKIRMAEINVSEFASKMQVKMLAERQQLEADILNIKAQIHREQAEDNLRDLNTELERLEHRLAFSQMIDNNFRLILDLKDKVFVMRMTFTDSTNLSKVIEYRNNQMTKAVELLKDADLDFLGGADKMLKSITGVFCWENLVQLVLLEKGSIKRLENELRVHGKTTNTSLAALPICKDLLELGEFKRAFEIMNRACVEMDQTTIRMLAAYYYLRSSRLDLVEEIVRYFENILPLFRNQGPDANLFGFQQDLFVQFFNYYSSVTYYRDVAKKVADKNQGLQKSSVELENEVLQELMQIFERLFTLSNLFSNQEIKAKFLNQIFRRLADGRPSESFEVLARQQDDPSLSQKLKDFVWLINASHSTQKNARVEELMECIDKIKDQNMKKLGVAICKYIFVEQCKNSYFPHPASNDSALKAEIERRLAAMDPQ